MPERPYVRRKSVEHKGRFPAVRKSTFENSHVFEIGDQARMEFTQKDNILTIDSLYVQKEARNNSLGTTLVLALERYAKERDIRKIETYAGIGKGEKNHAYGFYKLQGFNVDPRYSKFGIKARLLAGFPILMYKEIS